MDREIQQVSPVTFGGYYNYVRPGKNKDLEYWLLNVN